METYIVLGLAAVYFAWLIYKVLNIGKRDPAMPPGPPTLPLIGNVHLFPTEYVPVHLQELSHQWGGLYSLKVFNQDIIVINSMAACRDLLDKHGSTTGDRPQSYVVDYMLESAHVALANFHTDVWKNGRKALKSLLTPSAIEEQMPTQIAEATQLLNEILEHPTEVYDHIERATGGLVLRLLYGPYGKTKQFKGSWAEYFKISLEKLTDATAPGRHPPVDLVVPLRWVPERWAMWKRLSNEVKRMRENLFFGMLDKVENDLKAGNEIDCFATTLLKNREEWGLSRRFVGHLGGVLMDGGAGTSSSFIKSLVMALVSYPEVQKRAFAEVDAVVGSGRIPSLEDMAEMPFVRAVIREVHRFRPVFPMAIPHASLQDETCQGYLIPKGSTIFMNIYGIGRDPEFFDEPEVFNPERYLQTENGTKPGVDARDYRANLHFGSGRRICPGETMANKFLDIVTMYLIWAFEFNPAENVGGKSPIDMSNYNRFGLDMYPDHEHFNYKVQPRNARKADLIRTTFATLDAEL